MQLFAYDQYEIICAEEALRRKNYLCPECLGILRLKESIYYRKHFFHLKQTSCRSSKKNNIHLAVQKALMFRFARGEVILEKSFSSIRRIADLAWLPKKIIFEVQCSPIALKEVQARNADYAKIGYEVVWILHDTLFNQKKLSPTEVFLRGEKAYFTNINEHGKGIVYDQNEKILFNRRLFRGPPRPLSLKEPFSNSTISRYSQTKYSRSQSLRTLLHLLFLHFLKKNSR